MDIFLDECPRFRGDSGIAGKVNFHIKASRFTGEPLAQPSPENVLVSSRRDDILVHRPAAVIVQQEKMIVLDALILP